MVFFFGKTIYFLTESKVTKRECCCLVWFGSPKEYVLITNQRYFFLFVLIFFGYYKYFNWNQNAEQILLGNYKILIDNILLCVIVILILYYYNYKMSRQHTIEKETIQIWNISICYVWLSEISRRWSMHATLNTYSHSLIFLVYKANLTCAPRWYNIAIEFQEGGAWSWSLPRLH